MVLVPARRLYRQGKKSACRLMQILMGQSKKGVVFSRCQPRVAAAVARPKPICVDCPVVRKQLCEPVAVSNGFCLMATKLLALFTVMLKVKQFGLRPSKKLS